MAGSRHTMRANVRANSVTAELLRDANKSVDSLKHGVNLLTATLATE